MGQPRSPVPVLLVVVGFSRHEAALSWAKEQLQLRYGPIALSSEPYCFDQTRYYQDSMGTDLRKQLWAFEQLIAPDALPDIKRSSNTLEEELARSGTYQEERPINLDPGYLNLGKFVLATTKDQAHRIYLRDGILAEVTLHFQAGRYRPWPWTYADYRLDAVLDFLGRARECYRQLLLQRRAQPVNKN
jgi:hypothetical protein